MARTPLAKLPPAWISELGQCLHMSDERLVRQAVATIRATGITELDAALLQIARDPKRSAELRVAALAAAAPRLGKFDPSSFQFLLSRLDKDLPPLARLAAAEALGHARLEEAQLDALARVIETSGALEMPHLLAPFEHSKSPRVGLQLVAALQRAPGAAGLSGDSLRRTLQGYPSEVSTAAAPLFKKLEVDVEKQRARLAELEGVLTNGEAKRGRDVFFGKKAACSTCHTVQSEGGRVGPDLTKIGGIRAGRDLLEAVVFPSASFVRGYEPFVVTTTDGRQLNGIITQETADAIYLLTPERAEIRLPRTALETLEPGRISVMPQGLDAQLSREELGDLLAFLQSLR